MQQTLATHPREIDLSLDVDSAVDGGLAGAAVRPPVGRRGQLATLHAQLVWCDAAVQAVIDDTAAAMRDGDLADSDRWAAVQRLRALAWKVCREILPLVGRVPLALQADPAFLECQRVAHVLRRTTEAALRDNANYTVDLVAAAQEPRGFSHAW